MSNPPPAHLRAEYLPDPLGLPTIRPWLQWESRDRRVGARVSAYRVLVASRPAGLQGDQGDLWDSGRAEGAHWQARYAGTPLESGQRAFWKVRLWDQDGRASPWSTPATFGIGLLRGSDWGAEWIGGEMPVSLLRREFRLDGSPRQAALHVSALGLVHPLLNGAPVTDDRFIPGWAGPAQRPWARTYDVTPLLRPGPNALGFVLAPGWYSGHVGMRPPSGRAPRLIARLEISADAAGEAWVTDADWRWHRGPWEEADILMGERYDLGHQLDGWAAPGYDDGYWQPVVCQDHPLSPLPHPGPAVQVTAVLPASAQWEDQGRTIYDFGQNAAACVRLRGVGGDSRRIRILHAEALDRGSPYFENLRAASAEDELRVRPDEPYDWSPRFTYHGFRYAVVEPAEGVEEVQSLVLHSRIDPAGSFLCSSEPLNRLHRAIDWTLRSNALEVPTDCPQRDERLGWTGDAQLFASTACWHRDMAAFYRKWLHDLVSAQRPSGELPDVAPPQPGLPWGTPGWADAAVICAHRQFLVYEDRETLEALLPALKRWMDFRTRTSPESLSKDPRYGDWIAPPGPRAEGGLLGTAHLAHAHRLLAELLDAVGDETAAQLANDRASGARAALTRYLEPDGRLRQPTQTACALLVDLDLVAPRAQRLLGEQLATLIRRDGIGTGFLGTAHLLGALARTGHLDLAYRLATTTTFPSWGFMFEQGATTIWERWDGWTPEGGFQDPRMNSFNHCPLGSVGAWLFETVLGIAPLTPGFRTIRISPRPGPDLTWAQGSFRSVRGEISVHWRQEQSSLQVDVTLPSGVDGELVVDGRTRPLAPGPNRSVSPWGGP